MLLRLYKFGQRPTFFGVLLALVGFIANLFFNADLSEVRILSPRPI